RRPGSPHRLEDGSQALEDKVRLRLHTLGRFHRGVDPDLTGNPDRVPHTGGLRKVQGVVHRLSGRWIDGLPLRVLGIHGPISHHTSWWNVDERKGSPDFRVAISSMKRTPFRP